MDITVKIFVASSINEFKQERNELGNFILGINNTFRKRGIYCHLELCENREGAMFIGGRKQDEFNEFIKESDAVFVLFFKKAGKYTLEELKLAQTCFKERGRPKVYVYFKNFDENNLTDEVRVVYELLTNEYQHFFGTFENIATVKVDLLRAIFELSAEPALKVTESSGVIYCGDEPIMPADDLDYIKNSKDISYLKSRIAGLKAGDPKWTVGLYGKEIEDEIILCEERLKDRYNGCFKALEGRYQNLSSGAKIDVELQMAYNAASNGDYAKVLQILSLEKIKTEKKRKKTETQIFQKQYFEVEFKKNLLLINTYKETKDWDKLNIAYEEAVDAILSFNLYEIDTNCLSVWREYLFFLARREKFEEAVKLALKLDGLYSLLFDKTDELTRAKLWLFFAYVYHKFFDHEKCAYYCFMALEVFEKTAKKESVEYNGMTKGFDNVVYCERSNCVYEELEVCYKIVIRLKKIWEPRAEKYYLNALDFFMRLFEKNPNAFVMNLKESFWILSVFYNHCGEREKQRKCLQKQLEIFQSATGCELESDVIKTDCEYLALSYEDLALFYATENFSVAEEYALKSLKIRESNAKEKANNEYRISQLLSGYLQAAYCCFSQNEIKKGEKYCVKAVKTVNDLLIKHSGNYAEIEFIYCYTTIAFFYYDVKDFEKAERYLLTAISRYEKGDFGKGRGTPSRVASTYKRIGEFYIDRGQKEKAAEYLLKSIKIRESLSKKGYHQSARLAVICDIYASVTGDEIYLKKAYDYAKESILAPECREIVERLMGRFEC